MESSKGEPLVSTVAATSKALIAAARPKQWTKNLLVYFALFFTGGEYWDLADLWDLGDPDSTISLIAKTTAAFVLFSAVSSAVYLVNDIFDADKDRHHPKKRLRPIASGQLGISTAWVVAVGLASTAIVASFVLEPPFGWVVLGYLILMVGYSIAVKRIVLLDVFAISGGFVMRAVAGAAVIQVPISPWLYTCTSLAALFIALAKRRSELSNAGEKAPLQRDTLEWYTKPLLDQLIAIIAPSTLLAYTLYTFTAPNLPANHAMMLTVPIVAYGLFRYVYVVHAKEKGESPEDILTTDGPLVATILLWLASAGAILLVFRDS